MSVRNHSLAPFHQATFRHWCAALAAKEAVIMWASILLKKFLWFFNKLQFPDQRSKLSAEVGIKLNEWVCIISTMMSTHYFCFSLFAAQHFSATLVESGFWSWIVFAESMDHLSVSQTEKLSQVRETAATNWCFWTSSSA